MEQAGRFCPNCGSPVNPGAAFCPSCGQQVKTPAPEPRPTATPPPSQPQYVQPPQYYAPPPPYAPPPGQTGSRAGKSVAFWVVWAVLAVLSAAMLADGFSFLRLLGFAAVLAFPLLTRKSLFRRLRTAAPSWVGVFVAFILVLSLFPAGPGKSSSSGAITTGKSVSAASSTIASKGGSLAVNKTGDPLDGLTLTVPSGSYNTNLAFDISYAPVTAQSFGPNFNPVTPLITIENGGKYSNQLMEIRLPVSVPADSFAMGFIYDDATGKLEGMPLVAYDPTSITVATRHFSSFIVSMIKKASLKGDFDSGFQPGVDDWEFTNYGSAIAPHGHCAGQAMTAMWYYVTRPDGADASLYGRYDNNGQTPKTPDLWQDDSLGYRFASVIQDDEWDAGGMDFWKNMSHISDETTYNLFAYSIMITREPQFVGIRSSQGGGHAMIVYEASNGLLYIADPNYPGNIDRRIQFDAGAFKPYNSGANAADIAAGYSKAYEEIQYYAKTAVVDYPHIAARWAEVKAKTIGDDAFPMYRVIYNDTDGQYKQLEEGLMWGSGNIKLLSEVNGVTEVVDVYRDGIPVPWVAGAGYGLKPGANRLGIYVSIEQPDKTTRFVDFCYVTINFGGLQLKEAVLEGTPGQPLTFQAVLSNPLPAGYKIEWWADGALKKSGTDLSLSVSFAATGSHDIAVRMVDASGKTVAEDTGSAVIKAATTASPAAAGSQLAALQQIKQISLYFGGYATTSVWNAAGTTASPGNMSVGGGAPITWNGTSFSGTRTDDSTYEHNVITVSGSVSADGKTLLSAKFTFEGRSTTSDPARVHQYSTTLEIKNVPLLAADGIFAWSVEGANAKNYLVQASTHRVDTWNGTKDGEETTSSSSVDWNHTGAYKPIIGVSFGGMAKSTPDY